MAQQWRVGQGWDLHRLTAGRKLILGGVEIAFAKGLAGHSDADVITHAIIDALLGAAGEGNIGLLFPDTDPEWQDAASLNLLACVRERLQEKQWQIGNVDATIIAEAPKLSSFLGEMGDNIASTLKLPSEQVMIKAKTSEGVGPEGAGEAISAQAVALIWRE